MTVRLGDSHRRTPATASDFGPKDRVGCCPECGARFDSRHDWLCPLNPFNSDTGYET